MQTISENVVNKKVLRTEKIFWLCNIPISLSDIKKAWVWIVFGLCWKKEIIISEKESLDRLHLNHTPNKLNSFDSIFCFPSFILPFLFLFSLFFPYAHVCLQVSPEKKVKLLDFSVDSIVEWTVYFWPKKLSENVNIKFTIFYQWSHSTNFNSYNIFSRQISSWIVILFWNEIYKIFEWR